MRSAVVLGLLVVGLAPAAPARAFGGRWLRRGAGAPRVERIEVALTRVGDGTAVTVRHELRGDPGGGDLALVLAVPGPVDQGAVRTLASDALDRLDAIGAPRLVEYWERDPCAARGSGGPSRPPATAPTARVVEDAYQVSVRRPRRAVELARRLADQGWAVPEGFAREAAPYARAGYRFVVARVAAERLEAVDGRLRAPPLRFVYRSGRPAVPLGLGAEGAGPRELLIHVLAPARYEGADRATVLAPTNLLALPSARGRFDAVYASIFERVMARHPGALVTEYAWPVACERCAAPALTRVERAALGGDALGDPGPLVLTRLRTRLDGPVRDLLLRPGSPIAGGRGRPYRRADLEHRIDRAPAANAFQTRLAILHPWTEAATCPAPRPGRWGAPPGRRRPAPVLARRLAPPIPVGRLRRYLHTFPPVLRIPARGDASPSRAPVGRGPRRAARSDPR